MVLEHKKLDLKDIHSYKRSSLMALKEQVEKHFADISLLSVEDIKSKAELINCYPNLKHLQDLSQDDICILDEDTIDVTDAEKTVLAGELFFEHACAGEATRLGLGTKYLLNLKDIPIEKIRDLMVRELHTDIKKNKKLSQDEKEKKMAEVTATYTKEKVINLCGGDTKDLRDMSLGTRHMLQLAFDIVKLAEKYNKPFDDIIKKQSMLIIVNEKTAERIISEFIRYNFFSFDPRKVYFMIQQSFHGIYIKDGKLYYHEENEDSRRLHNHGQMYMQKTHENSIFFIDREHKRSYLSSDEYEKVLAKHKDLISYNIEDINYLTGSIDYPSLAKALELRDQGYEMVMEIVAQNPHRPQKGGAAFFDPVLSRNVMIETNRLLDIRYDEIKHLNKNFNHYPSPHRSYRKVKDTGLHMAFDIKKSKDNHYIYPCPIQGDINFLVKTAFLMRKELKPISNWKSPATTPPTVSAMFEQERQEGFIEFAKKILQEEI